MADADYSNEIWKDIPGWEGFYQASDMGRVRSTPRVQHRTNPYGRLGRFQFVGRVLTPGRHDNGYLIVALSDVKGGRKPRTFRVHRLVALTFLPNPEGKLEVAHNDGSRDNNCVSNLRWATRLENMADVPLHRATRTEQAMACG